jgi:beta-aspartyl-peptidase (threonine type)
MSEFVLAVHGGAGSMRRLRDDAAGQERIRDGLRGALRAGQGVLSDGGSALDAVEQAVRVLESNEAFNAGRGSVLNRAGEVEMDAAIMCGEKHRAGAVAAVRTILHPISAARAVMERTPHVLIAGLPAEKLALEAGVEEVDPEELATDERRRQLRRLRAAKRVDLDHGGSTVGAVALDRSGHLAAAASTGGMANKLPGRVGDSPIIGAGTWAADGRCAVSATGPGELIMRACVAHEIDAAIRLGGLELGRAASAALAMVAQLGGRAGCIAVDGNGTVAMPFTTEAMPRGVARTGEPPRQAIYDEELR